MKVASRSSKVKLVYLLWQKWLQFDVWFYFRKKWELEKILIPSKLLVKKCKIGISLQFSGALRIFNTWGVTKYIQFWRNLLLFAKTYQTERESGQVGCIAKKKERKREKNDRDLPNSRKWSGVKNWRFLNGFCFGWPVRAIRFSTVDSN